MFFLFFQLINFVEKQKTFPGSFRCKSVMNPVALFHPEILSILPEHYRIAILWGHQKPSLLFRSLTMAAFNSFMRASLGDLSPAQ